MAQVSPGLKLVSLNIEGSKHLDLVLSFLEREAPDVVCVQELFESDAPLFESRLGMEHAFAPICRATRLPRASEKAHAPALNDPWLTSSTVGGWWKAIKRWSSPTSL